MPHKRSSSDVTVDARIGSTSPFKQPNENVVTRRSSNDNIAQNLLADKSYYLYISYYISLEPDYKTPL